MRLLLVVLAVALTVNLGHGVVRGMDRPMASDAYYYYQLAVSLAHGDGYVVRDGFWPDTPSMRRLPAWPFLASLGIRLCPGLPAAAVMRASALLVNALAAMLIALLALRITSSAPAATLAALAYIFHPAALVFSYDGLAEPLFILLVAGGVLLLIPGASGLMPPACPGKRPTLKLGPSSLSVERCAAAGGGFLLLGLACLVRANFILWGITFAGFVVWRFLRAYRATSALAARLALRLALLALGLALFAAPPLLWMLRNYRVCGSFPVVSTLKGQTFYGGNNAVVAGFGKYWGYWIFPNSIPGETPMVELARTMSEYDVDHYYSAKGRQFIRANLARMPWLALGKLIRAYVPVPWHLGLGSLAICGYRLMLYIGIVLGLCAGNRAPPPWKPILLCMVIANVVMVVMFWGNTRFAFALEPFLLPFFGLGVTAAGSLAPLLRGPSRSLRPFCKAL